MIFLTENKKKKELYVYAVGDEHGYGSSEWQQAEVKRYSDMGYTVHSLVYPLYSKLPDEVREIYLKAYRSKGLLDAIVELSQEDILPAFLAQVVREELAKFQVEDIAETVVDYETSIGINKQ